MRSVVVAVMTLFSSSHSLGQAPPRFRLVTDTDLMTERASTGGISWVDFDGDGDDDAFATNGYDVSAREAVAQSNSLYENMDGFLAGPSSALSSDAAFSSGSAWADFDNDGHPDVFVPNQRGQNNLLYRNLGDGSFHLLENTPPCIGRGMSFSATWSDVDRDGRVDLFVSNGGLSGAERNFFYWNTPSGFVLEEASSLVADSVQTGGATFLDLDLDGDSDLFLPGSPTRMYWNDGDGNFEVDENARFAQEPSEGGLAVHGAWGDFDGDGDFDLFQGFLGDEPRRLYVNEGGGNFVRRDLGDATRDRGAAFHSLWVDLDNDGHLDLVVANYGQPPHAYRNRAGISLDRIDLGELHDRAWFASMVAASDFDLDGDIDLAVGNWPNARGEGEENLLYENRGPVGNWIALRLEGTRSNRDAIGARVVVKVRDGENVRTVMRDVRSQDGWRSQSSLELLIGLGVADAADSVRVFWPSGIVQDIGPVPAGERIRIAEISETPARHEAAREPPEDLVRRIEVEMADRRILGAAVAVLERGELSWARGFGFADLARTVEVRPDTPFMIGSVSKVFSALAVHRLVERKELRLDDPAIELLPELTEPYAGVTVRDLLSHTGGVRRDGKRRGPAPWINHQVYGDELLALLADTPPESAPGTRASYSNLGPALAALIVESRTGQAIDDHLQEVVFGPCGMRQTSHVRIEDDPTGIDGMAEGVVWIDGEYRAAGLESRYPTGSVRSTVLDLATFIVALQSGELIRAETRERMWEVQHLRDGQPAVAGIDGIGRRFGVTPGWFVHHTDDEQIIHHGGSLEGFSSQVDIDLETGHAVVVLCNNEAGTAADLAWLIRSWLATWSP